MATRPSGPILELYVTPDLYASGVLEIEHLDGIVRVTFYVERKAEATDELPARVPVQCMILTTEDCVQIGQQMAQAGSARPGVLMRYPLTFKKN